MGEPSKSLTPLIRRTTTAERCENGTLTLGDTVNTWGMGMCCIHCGLPVTIRIGHYQAALSGSQDADR